MSASIAPSPFRTFEHDLANDHSVMLLRGIAAVWTLACVVWLGLVLRNWVGLLMGLLGTLFSLVWAGMIAKARKRASTRVALRLTPDALVYEDAGRRSEVPWAEVRAVEVDEERLVVQVDRLEGEPVLLESMFRGVGVYDIADAVRAAWLAAVPARSGSARVGSVPDAPREP